LGIINHITLDHISTESLTPFSHLSSTLDFSFFASFINDSWTIPGGGQYPPNAVFLPFFSIFPSFPITALSLVFSFFPFFFLLGLTVSGSETSELVSAFLFFFFFSDWGDSFVCKSLNEVWSKLES
jgi:hypothetical protein